MEGGVAEEIVQIDGQLFEHEALAAGDDEREGEEGRS